MADKLIPLQAHQLVRNVGSRTLGPFSVDVARGEIVAIIGPNGSGKTTFLRLALGLDRADGGTSYIFGEAVDPLHAPMSVGYVPDRPVFWDWLDAAANLTPFCEDQSCRQDILDLVGLASVGHLRVGRFSRGMKQRLAIARAFATSPSLVVLDEPTIALDDEGVHTLIMLLETQRVDGGSVIISSHDGDVVERLATRVVRIEDGATVLT